MRLAILWRACGTRQTVREQGKNAQHSSYIMQNNIGKIAASSQFSHISHHWRENTSLLFQTKPYHIQGFLWWNCVILELSGVPLPHIFPVLLFSSVCWSSNSAVLRLILAWSTIPVRNDTAWFCPRFSGHGLLQTGNKGHFGKNAPW